MRGGLDSRIAALQTSAQPEPRPAPAALLAVRNIEVVYDNSRVMIDWQWTVA